MKKNKQSVSKTQHNQTDIETGSLEKVRYARNKDYDQESFNRVFDIWKLARTLGNKELASRQMNMIYAYCEKYVYKALWERYPSLMNNIEHRTNLVQEVWLKIVEQLPNYDYTKAGITTFISLWIPHVGTAYYSSNFTGSSNYFTEAMAKVNAAINMLQVHNVEITLDSLVKMTEMPEVTVKQALELLRNRERVSYESLVIEQPSTLPSPEAMVLQNEATGLLNKMLLKELNDEEIMVLQYLVSPKGHKKDFASYGEVAATLNDNLAEAGVNQHKYNVPKVKKIVSHALGKIMMAVMLDGKKERPVYGDYFAPIIKGLVKLDENGNMPILDDDDFIKEQKEEIMKYYAM